MVSILAGIDPILNFEVVQNFHLLCPGFWSVGWTGLKVCAHSGEFKDKRAAVVSRWDQAVFLDSSAPVAYLPV